LAPEKPRQPAGEASGRLGAKHLREHRQPLAGRGGIVVDDVVDPRFAAFQREHGRGGGVVEVDERGEAAPLAHDRELPLAHGLDQPVVGRAVEDPVAKRNPAGVSHRLVEIPHRGVALAHPRQRVGIERVVLGLYRSALACVAHAGEALRHEPLNARIARGGEERVDALGAKPIGLREAAVQVPGEPHTAQRGRLVDDRVRFRLQDRLSYGARVEQIERDRLRPERPQTLGAGGRVVGADHIVPCVDQLGYEPGSDRTAGSCYEDSHDFSFRSHRLDFKGLVL